MMPNKIASTQAIAAAPLAKPHGVRRYRGKIVNPLQTVIVMGTLLPRDGR
jgi:hypothetical protein